MNKQQVIDKLHKHLSKQEICYQKWEIAEIINPFLSLILEELNSGNTINLSQFGKFTVKTRKSRPYYNINTGVMDSSPEKRTIAFSPHRDFSKSPR